MISEGIKSVTGPQIFDHLENFFNLRALNSLEKSTVPMVLPSTAVGGAHSTTAVKNDGATGDRTYTAFQLPLKGFYRHFKEMTETSKYN